VILALAAGHALARAGSLVAALLAAEVLLSVGRTRRVALALALVLTPVLLAAELWHSTQLERLRHHHAEAAVAVIAALAAVVLLARLLRSRPQLLALLAIVALPFRFSVLAGGTGGILIPLYLVIWAGALGVVLWPPEDRPQPPVGWLERALALFVVLYAVQALYTPSGSLAKAVEEVGFFLVPFSLLYVLLRGVPWDRRLLERAALAVTGLALLFAAVAGVEYASRRLLFDTALNANERFFRVNSLFYDPNIFGRFLALTMILVVAAMLWERDRRRILVAAAVLVALWLGLLGSVSQSSMLALLAGLAVVAGARYSVRGAILVVLVLAAVGVGIGVADSGRLHLNFSDNASANSATDFRASLVREGVDLFADRPIAGFGSASFSCEYLLHTGAHGCAVTAGVTSDSHTIPVTIAAEQGLIGLAAYVLVLLAALWRLGGAGVRRRAARVALLAAFVALVVHSWAYADFLEDPITWTLLAVGTVLAAA
jgi:putative inorganic carbon (hco3(-)) transporter